MTSISQRGFKASNTILRFDMEISMEAQADAYHPVDNPTGTFPLNIAENRLCWEELKAQFQSISSNNEIPDWVMGYTSPLGDIVFRESIARFYERYLLGIEVDPMHLGCSPGATGIVEMTSFILADAGDVAAFPAPCYPVYRQDIGSISQVDRYDIITHNNINELQHNAPLNIAHLEKTKRDIEQAGKTFKVLVLTSPDNPTGLTYTHQQLQSIADWCINHQVHLIVNDIYALSRINITHSALSTDYNHDYEEADYGKIMAAAHSDYLHHWYSFSKDFGISGFRVGIVYSRNERFIRAYENLNLTHSVSNHTQWLLSKLIDDTVFIDDYITMNQKRLTASYVPVVDMLRRLDLPYVSARGSLFVWTDMSRYLSDQTQAAEEDLWSAIYRHTGVLLTPGHGFGHVGYGLFRIVYPYVPLNYLEVAIDRLEQFLVSCEKK